MRLKIHTYRKYGDGNQDTCDIHKVGEDEPQGGDSGTEEGLVFEEKGHRQGHGGAIKEGEQEEDVQGLEETLYVEYVEWLCVSE